MHRLSVCSPAALAINPAAAGPRRLTQCNSTAGGLSPATKPQKKQPHHNPCPALLGTQQQRSPQAEQLPQALQTRSGHRCGMNAHACLSTQRCRHQERPHHRQLDGGISRICISPVVAGTSNKPGLHSRGNGGQGEAQKGQAWLSPHKGPLTPAYGEAGIGQGTRQVANGTLLYLAGIRAVDLNL